MATNDGRPFLKTSHFTLMNWSQGDFSVNMKSVLLKFRVTTCSSMNYEHVPLIFDNHVKMLKYILSFNLNNV